MTNLQDQISSADNADTKRLYLQIADKLAQLINDGTFKPGERLPAERELASRYDVSRQTVREALIALEVSGIVAIRPSSGIYVLKKSTLSQALISEDAPGPLEIMEARRLLEGQACEMAASRISNEELRKLQAYIQQMSVFVEQQDLSGAEQFDSRFHRLIAHATRNSAIYTMIDWLWTLRDSSEISRVFAEKMRQHGANPNIEAHQAIYERLCQRDGEGARLAMENHLKHVEDMFIIMIGDA